MLSHPARALALACTLALAACSDDLVQPTAPDTRRDIVPALSRDTATLVIGDTLRLDAVLRNPQEREFKNKKERYAWASSDTRVATVDGEGLVRAVAVGTALVTVEHKGTVDTTTITVVLPEEGRALWVNRFEYATEAKIIEIMTKAKRANLNVVYFQVRGQGDAYYRSELEPCAVGLCGSLGNGQPSWDPLEVAVREAHARGIELHAWINAFTGWASPTANTAAYCALLRESRPGSPRHMLLRHPEWAMKGASGTPYTCLNSQAYEYAYVSPGIPAVRTHLARVAADITRRYAVDGIHLDRVRYPGQPFSYDAPSLAAFGRNAPATDDAWMKWRQDAVSAAVKEVNDSIKAVRRTAVLSAAVWPIYTDRWGWNSSDGMKQFFQDTWAWARGGYLDVAVPMTYFNMNAVYCSYAPPPGGTVRNPDWACMTDDHINAVQRDAGRQVYAGIGANRAFVEVEKEIVYGRSRGVKGFAFYSFNEMNSRNRFVILGDGLFKQPTRVPSVRF